MRDGNPERPPYAGPVVDTEKLVPWANIEPNPNQPRVWFDPGKLNELALSIAASGQEVAIIVVPHPSKEDCYIIVDGERRWRACGIAKVPEMKVVLAAGSEAELYKKSLIANFAREGHNAWETAHAIRKLKEYEKLSDAKLAAFFGKSSLWVTTHLSFFRLHPDVFALMHPSIPKKKQLKSSVALQLVALSHREQLEFTGKFMREGASAKKASYAIGKHRSRAGSTNKIRVVKHHTYSKIAGFTARIWEESELIAMLGQETFDEALKGRGASTVHALIENLDRGMEQIKKVRELLEKVPT
jgi:ParB/RepB/Spo0J family partition protein